MAIPTSKPDDARGSMKSPVSSRSMTSEVRSHCRRTADIREATRSTLAPTASIKEENAPEMNTDKGIVPRKYPAAHLTSVKEFRDGVSRFPCSFPFPVGTTESSFGNQAVR